MWPLSSEFGLKNCYSCEVQQCRRTSLWNIHQLNPVCMMFFWFSLAFSYFEISRCIVPRKWRVLNETLLVWELKRLPWGYGECLSHLSIPSTSTVPSIGGAQKVFVELSSNFSCPSQRSFSCPHSAASRSAPRNNIYSKDLCAESLGKRFPSLITSLLLPSVAFERTGTPRDSLLYPTSEKTWLIMGRSIGQP